ncbi:hypothetical protein AAKU55_004562 [Oxalobacteraceae bacterium GrIS 1.11]
MTSKEIDDGSDAELEAWLQGRGELADLLRALPQAGPSAELDAAILAAAETALAPAPAANDAVMPDAQRRAASSFMSRWKLPLALAASLLLTVNMIGLRWFMSAPTTFPAAPPSVEMAPAPVTAAAAAPAPAPAPAPAAETAALPAPEPGVKRQAASGALARSEPNPKPGTAMDAPVVAAPAPARSANGVEGRMDAAPMSAPVMAAPAPRMREQEEAAPQISARSADSARLKAARPAYAAPAAPAPDATPEPQAWLLKIEGMMKAGMNRDALDEWAGFRRAYPDYPVQKEFTERLEALRK